MLLIAQRPDAVADGGELVLVRTLGERFVLVAYEAPDDDPFFAALDVQKAAAAARGEGDEPELHEAGFACIPMGREAEDGGLQPRAYHVVTLADWRMGVVCTSDSEEVLCLGSRKPGEGQRWQRWILPDEEGPPSVPTFDLEDDAVEDQFVMGLALDLNSRERPVLIAGVRRHGRSMRSSPPASPR